MVYAGSIPAQAFPEKRGIERMVRP